MYLKILPEYFLNCSWRHHSGSLLFVHLDFLNGYFRFVHLDFLNVYFRFVHMLHLYFNIIKLNFVKIMQFFYSKILKERKCAPVL